MKIAIVENQRIEVDGIFNYANFKYYNNTLEFTYFETAQAFLKDESFEKYAVVFVDIELALTSSYDGYGLIKHMLELDSRYESKIVILTGHHKIEEKLEEYSLPKLPIILKPTDFKTVSNYLKKKGVPPLRA